MARKGFSDITTVGVAWGEDFVQRTIDALIFCHKQCEFGAVKLICPTEQSLRYKNLLNRFGIVQHHIEPMTAHEFSRFMVKNLHKYLVTKYLLNIQHDSAIIDVGKWDQRFFDYDYIGSPWSKMCGFENRVGNGGFSLRSKRFLKKSSELVYDPITNVDFHDHAHEDWFLCVKHYHTLLKQRIKFAPLDLAAKFSVEHPIEEKTYDHSVLSSYDSFGFHGSFNQAGYRLLSDNLETNKV